MGKSEKADELFEKHLGDRLKPPADKERAAEIGRWVPKRVTVTGDSWEHSSVDAAVAGLGWVGIGVKGTAVLQAWTYEGVAVTTHEAMVYDMAAIFEKARFHGNEVSSQQRKQEVERSKSKTQADKTHGGDCLLNNFASGGVYPFAHVREIVELEVGRICTPGALFKASEASPQEIIEFLVFRDPIGSNGNSFSHQLTETTLTDDQVNLFSCPVSLPKLMTGIFSMRMTLQWGVTAWGSLMCNYSLEWTDLHWSVGSDRMLLGVMPGSLEKPFSGHLTS